MLKYHIHSDVFDPRLLGENHIDRIQIEMIPDATRVLEIGCASGYMSGYLQRVKGCRVTGVESDPEAAAVARGRCEEMVTGSVDDESVRRQVDAQVVARGAFDVIFCSQMIEHVAEPERLLRQFHRWLSPTGRLVISTCNIAHWRCRLRLLAGRWEYEDYGIFDRGHLRFFTVHSFIALLDACGFSVEEGGYSYEDICPFKLLFNTRLLAPTDLLRLIPVVGRPLRGRYIRRMRNLIATQFAFKARRIVPPAPP